MFGLLRKPELSFKVVQSKPNIHFCPDKQKACHFISRQRWASEVQENYGKIF